MSQQVKVDQGLLKVLRSTALRSNQYQAQVSAAITGHRYRSTAYNYNVHLGGRCSVHAEEHLIAKCARKGYRITGCDMIVYRANGNGTSRPCPHCRELIRKAGLSHVVYFDGKVWLKEKA